ncbi:MULTISPECIES: helix-turn-helix transcriptional regulator [unclassified Variovorax]|uniref:helix-turn-helix domain-containing protein n=1 Tax=unclassified Variovorax TaxID=663243 RepID=UPI002575A396|nr:MULTISPECIES: helix-turn-helix transcriptional regulator [unclassified Variovorax]MDM0087102.1 helix-turn-helix transcriptional regulator [Variovorax sp. J22G40]MDM0144641.1 helix-turn-helix transcriptional regulator [Variovorax sp. J2P1-31]
MRQVLSVHSQFGVLLKAARKSSGISQAKLAERIGISQSRMSHMELHPETVNLEQLLAIFSVLDLELLVGRKHPAGPSTADAPSAGESPTSEW